MYLSAYIERINWHWNVLCVHRIYDTVKNNGWLTSNRNTTHAFI